MTDPLLSVRHLRTSFDTRRGLFRAVDGVSFALDAGQTLCVVGESGSGKSVVARSVMGLVERPGRVDPASSVSFDGAELIGAPAAAMRRIRGREIALIFQEPMSALNPIMPVGWQIAEPLRIHGIAEGEAARKLAVEMMDRVAIPAAATRAQAYPHEMSGGMLQRVVIAMALICRPRLLIADEPTTALDVTVQAQVLDLLQRLQAEMGMAMMLITHDLGVAWEMADRIAVMYAGQIVESGVATEVLGRPRHPYTAALLRSVPDLDTPRDQRLHVIRGMVPSAAAWPEGCRFADRCDLALPACRAAPPPLADSGQGRAVRCIRAGEMLPAGAPA